jgi:hypothetical protein
MVVKTAQTLTFSDFWQSYPKKRAKLDAEKAWKQALKRGVSPEAILETLALMKRTEWSKRKPDFLPYPASFLRGEAFDERVEALEDETPEIPMFICQECDPPHEWKCSSDILRWSWAADRHVACPEAIERMKGLK